MQSTTNQQTVKDFLYNDFTNCYEFSEYRNQSNLSCPIDHYKQGEVYYYSPFLSFGDYDNSCDVERANVRVFMKQFKGNKWIKHIAGMYGYESIGIDIFCDDNEILEVLEHLADYPSMDNEAVSEVKNELEIEAWSNYVKSDVERAIKTKFNIDLDDYNYNDEDLKTFFYNASDESNIYGEIESGGIYYIDIERVINSVNELPDNLISNPL